MSYRYVALALAGALSLTAASADAASLVTVNWASPGFLSIEGVQDFSSLSPAPATNPLTLDNGFITVSYFSPYPNRILDNRISAANPSWSAVFPLGLTTITPDGGDVFTDLAFDVGSYFGNNTNTAMDLNIQVLSGTAVDWVGTLTGVPYKALRSVVVSGNGDTFTAVNVYATPHQFNTGFHAGDADFAAIDNVFWARKAAPPPGVPEPASWALLLLGFFGAGFMLRRTRMGVAVS